MPSSPLLNRLCDKLALDATSRAAVATRVQNNTAIAKALFAVSDDVAAATAFCITFVLRLATTAAQVAAIIHTIEPSLSGNHAVKVFKLRTLMLKKLRKSSIPFMDAKRRKAAKILLASPHITIAIEVTAQAETEALKQLSQGAATEKSKSMRPLTAERTVW